VVTIRIFDREYSARKSYFEGTHRSRSPAETVADYRRHMPRMGITRLANVTGLDNIGVPVFVSVRPNSRSLSTSQGKGISADAARASALMEAIELWHAENIELPVRMDSYLRLRSQANVVDLEQLARVGPVNAHASRPWIEGWDLIGQRPIWVPHEYITNDFVLTAPSELVQSSNGLASGNHLLEAIVHGLCEVIERELTVQWDNSDHVQLVDLNSIQDPQCSELMRRMRKAELFVAAWNMTNEMGIPAFGALVMNTPEHNRWRVEGVCYGYGSHLHPTVALSRALSEAVQTRLTFIAGSRDDMRRDSYRMARDQDLCRDVYSELRKFEPSLRIDEVPSRATDTFEGDLEVLLAALRSAGHEQAVGIDLSKPDIGIPIVKVVVPGMTVPEGKVPLRHANKPQTDVRTDAE
jgi:YcaO-like protein with predicted kinase domain